VKFTHKYAASEIITSSGSREPGFRGSDSLTQTWYFDPRFFGNRYFLVHMSVDSQQNH